MWSRRAGTTGIGAYGFECVEGAGGMWKTPRSFSRREVPLAIYAPQKSLGAMSERRAAGMDTRPQDVP